MGIAANDPEAPVRATVLTGALRDLGWTEGKVRIAYRWGADSVDHAQAYATELVETQPDVLLANNTLTTQALQRQTRTIPIVFSGPTDAVETGVVTNLAQPGGNTTGFISFEPSMGGKWLELLKEIAPGVNRVLLFVNPGNVGNQRLLAGIEASARLLRVGVSPAVVRNVGDIESAIDAIAHEQNTALIVTADAGTAVVKNRRLISTLAVRHRLPAVYPFRYYSADGGLMSYGADILDMWRRAAGYVDRILKGEKAGDLPVQLPTKFEFVINLKTAKALGLTVPPTLLARADEVIE
jgi:putative ABC transport system substrate-binding protein